MSRIKQQVEMSQSLNSVRDLDLNNTKILSPCIVRDCVVMEKVFNGKLICIFEKSVESLIQRNYAKISDDPSLYKPYCLQIYRVHMAQV